MGRKILDLSNHRYGRLLVLERDLTKPSGAGKSAYWKCQCDCGNFCSIRSDKLTKEITKSCGCLSKEVRTNLFLKDLTNLTFNKLTVIKRDLEKPCGKGQFAYWICKCECGNIVSIRGDHLRNNDVISCGCINSKGEMKISQLLQENNISYKTQYSFDDLKGDYNNLRFDFAIFKNNELFCLIEFQGEQHFTKWGNEPEERFLKRKEYDLKKKQFCKERQIKLIEFYYNEYSKINWEYLKEKIKW